MFNRIISTFIRSKKRQIRLNVLFIGLLVISMFGISAILTGVALKSERKTLTDSMLQSNFEGARNLSVTVNAFIHSMRRNLGAAAKYIAGTGGSAEQITIYLEAMLSGRDWFNAVVTVDEQGSNVISIPGAFDWSSYRKASPAFDRALEARRPFISKPFPIENGRLAVLLTHPLFDREGQYQGFVGGIVHLEGRNVFSDLFGHATRSKRGTYAYVVDSSGQLLYQPDPGRAEEVAPPDEVVRKLMASPQGTGAVIDNNVRKYLAGYVTVPSSGWGVVFQSPAELVDDAMRQLVLSQLAWIIPLFTAMLLISLWIAGKLAAPFMLLTKAARRIAGGERLENPPFTSHWNYEAHHLAKAMMLAVSGLQHQADLMSEAARTDKLTGLANRASLEEWLTVSLTEAKPFTILAVDVDHFKSVNDTFGHNTGDEVLAYVAQTLKSETGEHGICFRFGGEEFIVLLPGHSVDAGRLLAERIRRRLAGSISPTGAPVTVSIGLARYPEHGTEFHSVFERADQALYEAKRSGRNRTVIAG
ncbi:diguanylate cyclase [Paenibacillus tarimensis]